MADYYNDYLWVGIRGYYLIFVTQVCVAPKGTLFSHFHHKLGLAFAL